jgi:quercetin dioxygenase-like cupin family protein
MVAQIVSYPPGGKSLPHRHAPSAFIYARVLSGAIRSQVGDEPVKVYQVGESWHELPGSHHKISENASDRDPASLLALARLRHQGAAMNVSLRRHTLRARLKP